MSGSTAELVFNRSIEAPLEQIYFAFTRATGLREWLARTVEASVDKGNYLFLFFEDEFSITGRFLKVGERTVHFTWRGQDYPQDTEVLADLEEENGGTFLTLTHSKLGEGDAWDDIRADLQTRWEKALDNLKQVLETGFDARVYNKPMVGILLGEFITPEHAARLSLPRDFGHQITGVLKNMGAEKAGLQKNDIITLLGGIEVRDFAMLDKAIKPHSAGDIVDIEFIRDGEITHAKFEFSSRYRPEIPAGASALSTLADKLYQSANAKLNEALDGVTPEQADFRPAPAEWNSKEVLAHLVLAERDTYSWAASLVQGQEAWPYTSQLKDRVGSMVQVYPTVDVLMTNLAAAQNEGIAFLNRLPVEFVERKPSYTRMAAEIMEGISYHYTDHIEQIENTLREAKALS